MSNKVKLALFMIFCIKKTNELATINYLMINVS